MKSLSCNCLFSVVVSDAHDVPGAEQTLRKKITLLLFLSVFFQSVLSFTLILVCLVLLLLIIQDDTCHGKNEAWSEKDSFSPTSNSR